MKKPMMMCVALLLSACGGGGGGNSASLPPYTPTPTPTPTVDVFYTRVLAFVSAQSETDEPAEISAVVATEPDSDDSIAI